MIINSLDLGAPSHPWPTPVNGQTLGTIMVEGSETIVWPRGSVQRTQDVSFWVKAWQGFGSSGAANSTAAMKYLLKQLEELAASRDTQPVFIQWASTADPAASYNAVELHDGWYVISNFEPDYTRNVVTGLVLCRMSVTEVAASPPRSIAMSYAGGPLTTNFAGTATNLVTYPYNTTGLESSFLRQAAEGNIRGTLSPQASPEQIQLSGTISDFFKGGAHVYDTINTGTNPVPQTGGLFKDPSWVEVFYPDHKFVGDCVVTNGLQCLLFQINNPAYCYMWNWALPGTQWQGYASFSAYDQSGQGGLILSYTLLRVGPEEVAIKVIWTTGLGGQLESTLIRLQRARFEFRVELVSLTQNLTSNLYMNLSASQGNMRITWTDSAISDGGLSENNLTPDPNYGYSATFLPNTTAPLIFGWLFSTQPSGNQGFAFSNSSFTLGDTLALPINARRTYGVFAFPFGLSGTYSTANLQQEMENATLTGGWVSASDAGSSGGSTAKLPVGTPTGAICAGPGFVPDAGQGWLGLYDCWARIRVTSTASGTTQIRIGWFDQTAGAYIASTSYSPSNFATTYAWYRVATNFGLVQGHTNSFRASSITNNAATTFWLDEMALVPKTLTVGNRGPQDIWQQFMFDHSQKLIRP